MTLWNDEQTFRGVTVNNSLIIESVLAHQFPDLIQSLTRIYSLLNTLNICNLPFKCAAHKRTLRIVGPERWPNRTSLACAPPTASAPPCSSSPPAPRSPSTSSTPCTLFALIALFTLIGSVRSACIGVVERWARQRLHRFLFHQGTFIILLLLFHLPHSPSISPFRSSRLLRISAHKRGRLGFYSITPNEPRLALVWKRRDVIYLRIRIKSKLLLLGVECCSW